MSKKTAKKTNKKPQGTLAEFRARLEKPILTLVDEVEDLRQRALEKGEEIRQGVLELPPVERAEEVATRASQSLEEATERARTSLEEATDKALDAVGLMRKSTHEEELKKLKKRHASLRKAAVAKALKKERAAASA